MEVNVEVVVVVYVLSPPLLQLCCNRTCYPATALGCSSTLSSDLTVLDCHTVGLSHAVPLLHAAVYKNVLCIVFDVEAYVTLCGGAAEQPHKEHGHAISLTLIYDITYNNY